MPPGELAKLKESVLLNVSQSDPQGKKERASSQGGALKGAQAGGGSANSQIVLPQHRPAVERFFTRPDKNKK